jgi:hypothetical protein
MTEKRLRPRLKVYMPIQAIGRSPNGEKFREICQTQDASAFGLCFTMQSAIERGAILYLSMRMPRRLRLYDLAQDLYQIYAQVQHIKKLDEGLFEVGVCFLGKNPPSGFENYRSAEFLSTPLKQSSSPNVSAKRDDESQMSGSKVPIPKIADAAPSTESKPSVAVSSSEAATRPKSTTGKLAQKNAPREKRRHTRHQIPIDVTIEFLDDNSNVIHTEPGLIVDISKHGACVMSTHEVEPGSRVRVKMMREEFAARASVKNVRTGQGGVWNLHIEFLDKCWMGGS